MSGATRSVEGIGMTSRRTRLRLIDRLRSAGISDERVLAAMAHVPRHLFVDEGIESRAYEDTALPIGHGQTISQPYIVALMTQAILTNGIPSNVLEVGTGSGYQAAILGQLVAQAYSVERIGSLLQRARKTFQQLGYRNIHTHHASGEWGWKTHAPYDAILVTAAPEDVPKSLLKQLKSGGRLIIPVGTQSETQALLQIENTPEGFVKKRIEQVRFVPLLAGRVDS